MVVGTRRYSVGREEEVFKRKEAGTVQREGRKKNFDEREEELFREKEG